jgi:hypothetical protein
MWGRKIVGAGRSAAEFHGRDGTPLVDAGSCRPVIFLLCIFLPFFCQAVWSRAARAWATGIFFRALRGLRSAPAVSRRTIDGKGMEAEEWRPTENSEEPEKRV